MALGVDLDIAVLAAFAVCAVLGFLRGFVIALLGFLILTSTIFMSVAIANSTLPVTLYAGAVDTASAKMTTDISRGVDVIRATILATWIGFVSPLIGILLRDIVYCFGGSPEATILSRVCGAVFGTIHCSVAVLSGYVVVGLFIPPQEWAIGLKKSYSLALVYDIGATADAVLPDTLRVGFKPLN